MRTIVSSAQNALMVEVAESRICAENAVELKDQLLALVKQGSRELVIDLGSVKSIDSSGIAAFLIVMKMVGSSGQLALCNLCANVEKAFRITRMDRVFNVFQSVEAALADYGEIELLRAA